MAGLKGLILAGTCNEDDDLVLRLQGRSRYAMPLANRALVRYAAQALIGCGTTDIAVAVSPATLDEVASLIGDGSAFGAEFHYIELAETTTALDTLAAAREVLGEHPLIVHSGDAVIGSGLREAVEDFDTARVDVLLLSEASHSYPQASLVGVRGGSGGHGGFSELEHVAPAAIVSATALREVGSFSAETTTIGGTVAALAEAGVKVGGRALDGCWCYAADCDHQLEGNRMILDQLPHAPVEAEFDSVRIEGRVAIHPDAKLERTTVRGPAVIGGGAELVDTFIGPYTSIGAGAHLDGAEIDHSIILERASIHHLGQRLETSIIGAEAQIMRDFGMPTALRLNIGRGSTVTLA
jgi:glucose-1-phosphate thymidylyltransferase